MHIVLIAERADDFNDRLTIQISLTAEIDTHHQQQQLT